MLKQFFQRTLNPLTKWALFVMTFIMALTISEMYFNILSILWRDDPTYISYMILVIMGYYSLRLGKEILRYNRNIHKLKRLDSGETIPDLALAIPIEPEHNKLIHRVWFVASRLPTLGILGTAIGLTFTLQVMANINLDGDISKLLLDLSAGLGVALYTTIAGLVGSLMLEIQTHFLEEEIDRYAEIYG